MISHLTLIDLNGLGEVANIHHKPDDQRNSCKCDDYVTMMMIMMSMMSMMIMKLISA